MNKAVAIVTGASTSIGWALVAQLLDAKYQVVAQINENVGRLKGLGGSLEICRQDLGDERGAQLLIERVRDKYGRVDVLVNTIGPLLQKPLNKLSPLDWQTQIHFNLNLAFYLSHYALPDLIASKGHIINFAFSGVDQLKARNDSTAYCAAKAGLVVLTKSLASALAEHGVRVNAICPGLIEEDGMPSGVERELMAKEIPFGRPGLPSEVAEVLAWLVTTSPKYLTGALISVAGAWEYVG